MGGTLLAGYCERHERPTYLGSDMSAILKHAAPIVIAKHPYRGYDEPRDIVKHADHRQKDHGNWARRGHLLPVLEARSLAAGVSLSSEDGERLILEAIREDGSPKTVYRGSRRMGMKVGDEVTWGRPVLSTSDRRHLGAGFTRKEGDYKTLVGFRDAHALDVSDVVAESSQWEREHLIEGGTWRLVEETMEPNENYPNVMYRVLWAERIKSIEKHGGGSHEDEDHGNWADDIVAEEDPIDPKARVKGQRRLFGSKTVGPQEAVDRWRERLEGEPPDDWDPRTLDKRIDELGMDEVTPEFRGWIDKGVSEVLAEGRIGDFAEKYGESQWIIITKGQFGEKNPGYLGQFFDSWGDQIAIYEGGFTTPYEGQAEEKMWHNKDILHTAHDLAGDTKDRLPSHAVEGMKGTMRHEFGHYIMSQLTSDQRHEWVSEVYGTRMVEMGADGGLNYGMLGKNSEKQYDWYQKPNLGGTFPSTYAMVNDREGFAETFAIVTHPDFDRSEYDPEIFPLFDFIEGLA